MRIRGTLDATAVPQTGIVQAAQLFERLPAVKIGSRITRIRGQHFFEFGHRIFELTRVDVLHRQAVAGQEAGGVLLQQVFQKVDAREFQLVSIALLRSRCRINPNGVPFFRAAA